ncbi:hypothetical protein RQP46_005798 [Phenoliferia psychrophenolica]
MSPKTARPSPSRKRSSSNVAAPSPPPSSSSTPPPPLWAVAATLLFASTPTRVLYPLFSASPTESISSALQVLLAFVAVVTYALLPLPRLLRWQVLVVGLGLVLVSTDGVARVGGERWMKLGVDAGVWVARLAVEGPATVLRWWIVLKWAMARDRRGSVRALCVVALPLYLASGWQPPAIQLVPECYILQAHGLLLILLASTPIPSLSPSTPSTLSPHLRILLLLFSLSLALLTSFTSTHCPSSSLRPAFLPPLTNSTSPILASKKSLTGWIVVGETENKGHSFRYLRADHSLLGGLWVGPARKEVVEKMLEMKVGMWEKVDENAVVGTAESIYSTFIMQEIARFAGVPEKQMKRSEKALIIGLGAGLAARSFEMHGVKTTIVEIDPVVYEFATEYFGVTKPTGGVALEDARVFLSRESKVRYDYIIHDVFTGGTVPSTLFTSEFWTLTKSRLLPTGIVAINFAGNITSRASHLVLSTILSSFSHCRAWEDGPPKGDYRNIVVLCSANPDRPIRMRNPVQVDFIPYPTAISYG